MDCISIKERFCNVSWIFFSSVLLLITTTSHMKRSTLLEYIHIYRKVRYKNIMKVQFQKYFLVKSSIYNNHSVYNF